MLSQLDKPEKPVSKSKEYVLHLDTVENERKLVAPMCKMHFAKQPMKVQKAKKQYIFDDAGKRESWETSYVRD